MDWKGYTGNILKIDLTEDKISIIKQNIADIKQFIGGLGINTKLLADLNITKIDPLSPKNVIIIGVGPLVGTITPGASRTVASTKFPATRAIAYSCGSMSFGFNLKHSGFDHIIISGKAEDPVYLAILNEHIELIDASDIWGRDIVESTNFLLKKNSGSGVIAIGQAGENLIYGSLALIDKTSTFGRGGLGAVMGSKNLKAIVVKGTKGISIANPKDFNQLYKKLFERIRKYPQRESWHELGMLRSLPVGMILKASGQHKKARQCSEKVYLKKLKNRRIACPSCPMGDKDILELQEGKFNGLINYTSSVINPFLMFTLDDLNTYDEAIKIFDLVSRYGLDSLTITSLLKFCTHLYEKGILKKENTGIEWKNDYQTAIKLIEMIVSRKGFGDILADGWKKLAKIYKSVENEMLTVKGLDIIFEPRLLRLGTMEFEQVVNPKGAHVASGGSPTYLGAGGSIDKFKMHFDRMGVPNSAIGRLFTPPLKEMVVNVGRLTRYSEDWYTILTSLGLCARAQMNRFYGLELVTDIYKSVTGFDIQSEELREAAERTWNLLKILNVKEGFSRKDDKFPKEWFKPLKFGQNILNFQDFFGETIITPEVANQLLNNYYDERGWDKIQGIPTQSKLKELNLEKYL
ncbi:MAG: aldehyde ferredoxin oxidoreductase C-terminal domain-containing protein [Candidatus Hodarchaeota archaeon]